MAALNYSYLSYRQSGFFSKLVNDYTDDTQKLQHFFAFTPDLKGISEAIALRNDFAVDRPLLCRVLQQQYQGMELSTKVKENLALLQNQNTYTICTAHQPNLMGGYLYFIYKILHAIHLAGQLKTLMPHNNFVPVYYMGAEDNDLEELGRFRYADKEYVWDAKGQTGAVGRMKPEGLEALLQELFKHLGPPGPHCNRLKEIVHQAYTRHNSIAAATAYWVNELLGDYGLIIINPDEADFKRAILPIIKDELLEGNACPIVQETCHKLEANYKVQAWPRPLNLFYLKGDCRERIEKEGEHWKVLHTDIVFTRNEILQELQQHPERFSPNVILRGLLQESILPNVAFIGGGAEVAYWLQLRNLFTHYKVFYPPILLRRSVLWVDKMQSRLLAKTGLSWPQIFTDEATLINNYVKSHAADAISVSTEQEKIAGVLNSLQQKASNIDSTLQTAANAIEHKINALVQALEHKMLRAQKRKMEVELQRIKKLKQELFPANSLQERRDNFLGYYAQYGPEYFNALLKGMDQEGFLICAE
jgi:bacillithiol biosynthesis cysteine-adding enzyme BshC